MVYENPFEHALTGQEVKDWVWYHTNNKTRYTKTAKALGKVFNLENDRCYILTLCNKVPIITEVPEKGIKYDIPCEGEE